MKKIKDICFITKVLYDLLFFPKTRIIIKAMIESIKESRKRPM